MAMNVRYLLPFVEAAYEVLEADASYHMKRGDLALDKNAYITQDITVIISLIGDVEGTVFYGMSTATGLSIASAILGEQLNEFSGLAQSGIAELGNVITGRASVKLSHSGFHSNISPPTLLIGGGATISTLDFPRLLVPLVGEPGQIEIHIALRENKFNKQKTASMQIPDAPKGK